MSEWQVNKFTSFIDMHFDLLLSQVFCFVISRRMEKIVRKLWKLNFENIKNLINLFYEFFLKFSKSTKIYVQLLFRVLYWYVFVCFSSSCSLTTHEWDYEHISSYVYIYHAQARSIIWAYHIFMVFYIWKSVLVKRETWVRLWQERNFT